MSEKVKFKKLKQLICYLFGHDEVFCIEERYHASGVKCRKHSYDSGIGRGNKSRLVRVGYMQCRRCKKKTSMTQRLFK